MEATGQGNVVLEIASTSGKTSRCELHEVLYVHDLSYNLLSVSKAVEAGKVVEFNNTCCQILDTNETPMTVAMRVRNLYYLNCLTERQQANTADNQRQQSKEDIWHSRYGHLGFQNLQKLAKKGLVDCFDYNSRKLLTSASHAWRESNTEEKF